MLYVKYKRVLFPVNSMLCIVHSVLNFEKQLLYQLIPSVVVVNYI